MADKTNLSPATTRILSLPPVKRQVGNTTYIVTAHFSPNASVGVLHKLRRLVEHDGLEVY